MNEAFATKTIQDHRPRIAFDIGANFGDYTVLLASQFQMVYALEPHPDNYRTLLEKVEGLPNVVPMLMAVAPTTGRTNLYVNRSHYSHTISQMVVDNPNLWNCPKNTLEVDCTTIDDLSRRVGQPSLIKMDIEGGEGYVWGGGIETLRAGVDVVLEVHQSVDYVGLTQVFLGEGYEMFDDRGQVVQLTQDTHYHIRRNFSRIK